MKKLGFLATCPGCSDTHVEVKCKKPTFIVPVVTKAVCDKCDSVVVYEISLPRNRENNTQVRCTPTHIVPSAKLVQIMNARQEIEKLANSEEQPAPVTTEVELEKIEV